MRTTLLEYNIDGAESIKEMRVPNGISKLISAHFLPPYLDTALGDHQPYCVNSVDYSVILAENRSDTYMH